MGLLEDLEQEAQKRKVSADDVERLKMEREEVFKTQLDPGMSALYEYLTKLVANLKILQPKKALRFTLGGYGEIVGYVAHEYDLQVTSQPGAKEIRLGFPCHVASEECPTVEIQGLNKVRSLAGTFQRYHLGGLLAPKKDANGEVTSATFKAKGKIMLSAVFSASVDNAAAKISFTNFDQLGVATKTVPPAQLSESLFDEIGRYLMREPNNLFRETLPEAYRLQLRSKVQQEEMKRKWESKISAQQQTDLSRLRRDHSVSGKLGKLVGQGKEDSTEKPWLGTTLDKLRGLVKKKV